MTDFTDLNTIETNLIVYWLGNFNYFGYLLLFLFFGALISKGIPLNYAVLLSLPLIASLTLTVFLTSTLLVSTLLIVSFIYAITILVLFN